MAIRAATWFADAVPDPVHATGLWVIDSSCFPSPAALDPALTIAADTLRVAPRIASAAHRTATGSAS